MDARFYRMFLLALALLAATPPVAAQQYVGASIGSVDFGDFTSAAIIGRYGMKLNDFFSAEVRYGFSVSDDSDSNSVLVAEHELNGLYGIYGRYGLPLDEAITWYVVLGYSFVEDAIVIKPRSLDILTDEDIEAFTFSDTNDWSGVSYGFGTDWHFHRWWTLNFEYTGYVREQNLYIDGLSLGIVRRLR